MIKIDALLKLREPLPTALLACPSPSIACRPYKALTLCAFHVRLEIGGTTHQLSTGDAHNGDGFRSRGFAFARRIVPLVPGTLLEQQILLPDTGDAVAISWRLIGHNIRPVRLTATPIFSSADRISSEIFIFDAEHDGGRLTWSPFSDVGKIIADTNGHCTEPTVAIDFNGQENTAAPSAFVFDLGRSTSLLLLSVEVPANGATDPLVGQFLADCATPRREHRYLPTAAQGPVPVLRQLKPNSSRIRRPYRQSASAYQVDEARWPASHCWDRSA
jgi:hypothetical protein